MNEVDARMRAVDERLPQRSAAATYRPDTWTIRLIGGNDTACAVGRFAWRDLPHVGPWDGNRRRFQAAKAAFDYAVQWVDPVGPERL